MRIFFLHLLIFAGSSLMIETIVYWSILFIVITTPMTRLYDNLYTHFVQCIEYKNDERPRLLIHVIQNLISQNCPYTQMLI
jgi:hypothetical protein